MPDPKYIQQQIEKLITRSATWKGRQLNFTISLTDGRNYDRHGTSFSYFSFELGEIRWRTSGARLMISGPGSDLSGLVEMSIGALQSMTVKPNSMEAVERVGWNPVLGKPVLRKTYFKVAE